jgi:DNA-binding transcriptional ArsR family regulator
MSKRRVDRRLASAAVLFAALGDAARLALVDRLAGAGPASISSLAQDYGLISRQGVTKHLQVLASAGIVQGQRRGREHVWAVNQARLDEARRSLDAIGRRWDEGLARLKAHVERTQDT